MSGAAKRYEYPFPLDLLRPARSAGCTGSLAPPPLPPSIATGADAPGREIVGPRPARCRKPAISRCPRSRSARFFSLMAAILSGRRVSGTRSSTLLLRVLRRVSPTPCLLKKYQQEITIGSMLRDFCPKNQRRSCGSKKGCIAEFFRKRRSRSDVLSQLDMRCIRCMSCSGSSHCALRQAWLGRQNSSRRSQIPKRSTSHAATGRFAVLHTTQTNCMIAQSTKIVV